VPEDPVPLDSPEDPAPLDVLPLEVPDDEPFPPRGLPASEPCAQAMKTPLNPRRTGQKRNDVVPMNPRTLPRGTGPGSH
jgi:hypothetical protein